MMPKIIVLGLLIGGLAGLVNAANGQSRGEAYTDSLEKALATAKDKSARLSTLSYLADWYLYRDLGKSMDYLLEADRLGWKNWKDAYLIAKSFGTAYQIVGYYDSAVYWQQLAHNSAIKAKNTRYEGITANNLANAYYGLGQFDSAYVYALRAMAPAQKAKNQLGLAISKELIAILEGEFGHMDSSLSYFLQSAQLFKSLGETNYEALSYLNAVKPMSGLERYESCWELIRKAEALLRKEPDPYAEASLWFAKGHVNNLQGKHSAASQAYDRSYIIYESLGASERLNAINFGRGKIKYAMKEYAAAEQYFLPLIAPFEGARLWFDLTQLYSYLAEGYRAQNKMEEAFEAMQKLDAYRDSLYWITKDSELASMAVKYALDKANTELRNVAQRAEVARRQFYAGIGVLLFGLAALSLIIWLISKNKRQTEKLNAQLAGQNALKDRLFASIGHDLRSPLAQSYAALRILRRKLQDMPEVAEGLARVQAGQGHALQVTDDLLGWVALQWGGETQLTAVDVQEVVNQVVQLNRNALDDKQLQLQLPHEAPPKVKSDAQAVALLVRNFLTNAIKFSPASATITFGWGVSAGRPWLSISDAGKGFPADWLGDLQALAARNERLPSEQGSAGETGTGLGLMLCATFAKQIGATVLLEAPMGGGARVKIDFPPLN